MIEPNKDDGGPSLISGYLRESYFRILAWSESFVSGRHWVAKVVLLAAVSSLLITGGIDTTVNYSEAYYQKIDNPLLDLAKIYPPYSHDAKLNFRLTVPAVLHFLPLRDHWILPALTIFAIVLLLWLSCTLAYRMTKDRVCAMFVALEVSATYIGSFGFIAFFDAIALAQLLFAAMPGRHWFTRGAFVFTAAFTDERALVASGFLLAQSLYKARGEPNFRKRVLTSDIVAVLAAVAAYGAARILLARLTGLSSPLAAVGLGMLVGNMKFLHAGVWFALEGGWLLFLAAAIALYRRHDWLVLAMFSLVTITSLCAGFMTGDVLRGTSYVLLSLPLALAVISENENIRGTRTLCFVALAISVVGGNYNVFLDEITWFMPLPLELLYHGLDAVRLWGKTLIYGVA